MAKIDTITLADGSKRYRFAVDVGRHPVTGKRQQRRFTFRRMKDARAELARLNGAVAAGTFVDRSRETVSETLDRFLRWKSFGKADNTVVSYRGALLPVRERLGDRKTQSLTREDIERLRDWMLAEGRRRGGKQGTKLGPRSVRLTLGTLRAALELACRDGRLAANPARYVQMPGQQRREATIWSRDELRAFLAVADSDRLAAAWRLMLYGLRRGEVCGLRWDDVDLDERTVTVDRSRVLVSGRVIVKSPKSKRGFRTLPLFDDTLIAALRSLRTKQAAERLAAGPAYEASGYVVADELGAAPSPMWFTNQFHRLAAAAEVPRIRLHDGRHTVNSLLADANVAPHVRAAWCGHTTAVNEAVYTNARPEDLEKVAGILNDICNAV